MNKRCLEEFLDRAFFHPVDGSVDREVLCKVLHVINFLVGWMQKTNLVLNSSGLFVHNY